jgi:hypothetical protein
VEITGTVFRFAGIKTTRRCGERSVPRGPANTVHNRSPWSVTGSASLVPDPLVGRPSASRHSGPHEVGRCLNSRAPAVVPRSRVMSWPARASSMVTTRAPVASWRSTRNTAGTDDHGEDAAAISRAHCSVVGPSRVLMKMTQSDVSSAAGDEPRHHGQSGWSHRIPGPRHVRADVPGSICGHGASGCASQTHPRWQ